MMIAMMYPSTVPLFRLYYRTLEGTSTRARAARLGAVMGTYALAWTLTGIVPLAVNASSYRSDIGTLQDAEPDIVQMTAGTEVSTLFVKNYSELGAKEDFNLVLGNDVLTEDFISQVGSDVAEGFLGQAPAPGPAFDEFSESFGEVNDGEPGTFAAEGYDSVNQLALAFDAHGAVERQAIPEQLRKISNPPGTKVTTFAEGKKELANGNDINYNGADNPQNFDKNGNVVGPFSILQAKGGTWESIKTYRAKTLRDVYSSGD
jgi:hypothetical protein